MENDRSQPDRAALDDFQRELIDEFRKRLKKGNLSNADLCKFADKCVDLQKQANDCEKLAIARERLHVSRKRIDAQFLIAREKNDTALDIARLRAEAISAKRDRNAPDHPQRDDDDPTAPYGRKKDGTAYTQEEFKDSLNEAINDIYGLPPINPKSQMPAGWNRSSEPANDAATRAGRRSAEVDGASPDRPPAAPFRDRPNSPFEKSSLSPAASSNPKETAPARYPSGDG